MLRSIKRSDRSRKKRKYRTSLLLILGSALLSAAVWNVSYRFQFTETPPHSSPCSSAHAAVMGLAAGYDLTVLRRFVGSLRQTGYCGHIILGVAPDVTDDVLAYLQHQDVAIHRLQWTPCDYQYNLETIVCAPPYANLKLRWGRYPLARDWLLACPTCTGPVLVTDVRDVVFQRDPFDGLVIDSLQLFAEHPYQTTLHKLVKKPIRRCKHMKLNEPMLCSGTTVGTREAVLTYLEVMYQELQVWARQENCRLINREGGDQAVHNYIYYTGKLPSSTQVIPFRASGVVNTVAVWGKLMEEQLRNHSIQWDQMWKYNVTDRQGYFLESDGSRSRTVHQFDRFDWAGYDVWLQEHFGKDLDERK
ncbi:hypothetical protein FisN_6Hh209 [Fistulifera solaris]|uniref:Uncharacterized protein n=1 Tax=Fistulifera solaris TaxID=1519565 RepID=A0A1Z5K2J8_FISSO|nr:hypothetical protein FisN_6Hh209 [Fistulifera solaris]|eukprot:GAX20258.1 hypothetical protein FisN_6Hh209 [Fistulifera solaris]